MIIYEGKYDSSLLDLCLIVAQNKPGRLASLSDLFGHLRLCIEQQYVVQSSYIGLLTTATDKKLVSVEGGNANVGSCSKVFCADDLPHYTMFFAREVKHFYAIEARTLLALSTHCIQFIACYRAAVLVPGHAHILYLSELMGGQVEA